MAGDVATLLAEATAKLASGSVVEALQLASQALRSATETKTQADALCAVAQAHLARQSFEEAAWRGAEAVKLFRELKDNKGLLASLEATATAQVKKREFTKAVQAAKDGADIAKQLGDKSSNSSFLCLQAKALVGLGQPEEALGIGREALLLAREVGSASLELDVLDALTEAHLSQKQAEEAFLEMQQAIEAARRKGDKVQEAKLTLKSGSISMGNKEYDNGLRAADTARMLFSELADQKGQGDAALLVARLQLEKQDSNAALRAGEQAKENYRSAGKVGTDGEIAALQLILGILRSRNAVEEAFKVCVAAIQTFVAEKEKKGEASMLLVIADLHLAIKQIPEAMRALTQTPSLFAKVGDKRGEATAWAKLAQLHMLKGESSQALKAAEESVEGFKKVGDKQMKASMLQVVADAHFALAADGRGNGREALIAAQEALQTYRELEDKAAEAVTLHMIGNAQLMVQDFAAAQKAAKAAEGLFRDLNDVAGEASSVLVVAGAHLGEGEFEEARRCGREARELFNQVEEAPTGLLEEKDTPGLDSVEDFMSTLKMYESGELSRRDFVGFSMKAPTEEEKSRKRKQVSIQTISSRTSGLQTLFKGQPIPDEMRAFATCLFESFEVRRATTPGGAAAVRERKGSEAREAQEREAKLEGIVISKEQACYAIKWVHVWTADQRGVQNAAGAEDRDWAMEKKTQVYIPDAPLGQPRPGFAVPAGRTSRTLDALARRHGVTVGAM